MTEIKPAKEFQLNFSADQKEEKKDEGNYELNLKVY